MKLHKVFVSLLMVLALIVGAYALPDGATTTVGTPETKADTAPGNATAEGGNITAVNLGAETKTLAWQGFYGNVSGNITLEDASSDVLYSWVIANLSGEVFASRSSSIDFTTVEGVTTCTVDEDLTGTGTDRTNNTFTNTTVDWTIGTVSITEACQTFTFRNNATQSAYFEEIILNATGVTSIYTTRINDSIAGFNGELVDYQMIVADNRTSATSVYFFFAEFD